MHRGGRLTPEWARRLHYLAAIAWLLAFPLTIWQGWQHSVAWLVFISLYANVVGHWSSGMAMRVEVEMKDQ